MECTNATSLRRKSGQWGTQLLVIRSCSLLGCLARVICALFPGDLLAGKLEQQGVPLNGEQ
jgi:hypothetical protein